MTLPLAGGSRFPFIDGGKAFVVIVFPSDFSFFTDFPFTLILLHDSLTHALLDVFPDVRHGVD